MFIPIQENGEKLETVDPKEFFCEPVYYNDGYAETPDIQLRSGVVEKLRNVQKKLKTLGPYRLKIFDGFRPIQLQLNFYNQTYQKFQKENPAMSEQELQELTHKYFAFPSMDKLAPAPHNTGGAVDLTIVDEKNAELPMGTPFDDFSNKSNTEYFAKEGKDEKDAQLFHANRMMLKKVMEDEGFKNYPEEWWHYNFGSQEWVENGGGKVAVYGSAEL